MILKATSLCVLFVSIALCGHAQHFPIRKLSVEDGLGHSVVYRTYQSRDGYLWFSTDNGLTRYDGAAFRNYTSEDGLASNFVFDVTEWQNRLYVCTLGGGLMIMDGDRFVPAFDSSYNQPLHPVELRFTDSIAFVIDRFKSLHILDGRRFRKITPADLGLTTDKTLDFFDVEVVGNEAYIASNDGLFLYKDHRFQRIPLKLPKVSDIYKVCHNSPNTLLIVINNYLIEYDLRNTEYTILIQDQLFTRYSKVYADSEQNIWVSTLEGKLFFVSRQEGMINTVRILEDVVLNDVFEDREKNIWLSTYGEGAWFIQSTHVRNYPVKGFIVSYLAFDPQNDDDLLITTVNSGIKTFRHLQNGFLEPVAHTAIAKRFHNKTYMAYALNTPDGSLLLTSGTTLFRWSKSGVDSLLTGNPITCFYIDERRNRIWIGSRFSLAYCDMDLGNHRIVEGFSQRVIRAIESDTDGSILIGTDAGLFIETSDGFQSLIASTPSVERTTINALHHDRTRHELWAATNSGLAVVRNGRVELVDNPVGRVRCNSIAGDGAGKLFVGTVGGLLWYDGRKFEQLTTKDGLAQSNILQVICRRDKNMLILLGPNSVSLLDIETLTGLAQFQVPEIHIESVTVPGENTIYGGGTIRLDRAVRQLNILTSSPQIGNRDKLRYSYQINNRGWIDFNGRQIFLHSPPVGDLSLTVKVYKNDDPDNAKLATLSFVIPLPFYLKWWFISFLVGLAVIGIYVLVLIYSRKKNQKLLDENQKLAVEHRALRNLLNPHFLYNALNSIHAFILENDQRKTLAYLSKFSQLVRLNLDLLAHEQATLAKEVRNISLYLEFEKLRFAEKLNYTIDVDPAILKSDVVLPSFIIQPFIENAIWHGLLPRKEGGNLNLKISNGENRIVIVIEDDGIGINQSMQQPKTEIDKKSSMGISIIRERFELLKKLDDTYHLSIVDKGQCNELSNCTGTRVTMTIPAPA